MAFHGIIVKTLKHTKTPPIPQHTYTDTFGSNGLSLCGCMCVCTIIWQCFFGALCRLCVGRDYFPFLDSVGRPYQKAVQLHEQVPLLFMIQSFYSCAFLLPLPRSSATEMNSKNNLNEKNTTNPSIPIIYYFHLYRIYV